MPKPRQVWPILAVLAAPAATQPGFLGGTLACAPGCTFDTSGCYATRFDASGATIIDNQTGLEWEKKDSADGAINIANPHDVDNSYHWSSTGTAPDSGLSHPAEAGTSHEARPSRSRTWRTAGHRATCPFRRPGQPA